MNILQKLSKLIGKHTGILIESSVEPDQLGAYINVIRSRAFERITGKRLAVHSVEWVQNTRFDVQETTKDLSPVRRIARRGL